MIFGIFGNTSKPAALKVSRELIAFLRRKRLPFVLHDRLATMLASSGGPALKKGESVSSAKLPGKCDVLIALGGDGTMLETARIVDARGTPILGVNLGKLGFMAELSPGELRQSITDLLNGDYAIEERMVIEVTCSADGRIFFGLNDVVIDRGTSARMIEIETFVNGDYLVTYASDGLILATPTGSTAYSLSTGGPIVTPACDVILLNPIAPHTLTARPLIIPSTSVVRITIGAEFKKVHITADGQEQHSYSTPCEFIARKAGHTIKLIKRKDQTYYDVLRAKLLWGSDIRVKSNNGKP